MLLFMSNVAHHKTTDNQLFSNPIKSICGCHN